MVQGAQQELASWDEGRHDYCTLPREINSNVACWVTQPTRECFQKTRQELNFTTLAWKTLLDYNPLCLSFRKKGKTLVKEIEGISLWKRHKIYCCQGQGLIRPWNQLPTEGSIFDWTNFVSSKWILTKKEWLIYLKLCRGKAAAVRMRCTMYVYKRSIFCSINLTCTVVWTINSGKLL